MAPPDEDMTHPTAEAEDWLRLLAHQRGISRRRFLQLLSVGGAAAVLAACFGRSPSGSGEVIPTPSALDPSELPPWFKDPTPFIQRPGSLEARLENMQGVMTPNKFFFMRNNSTSMDVDATSWRLLIEGDAVSSPMELSYSDIQNMPSSTLISYLECAGNHRAMFDIVNGQKADGTQWERGAVGNGEWIGVPLRDVLTRAGITEEAAGVLLIGLDEESPEDGFRRAMSVEKAMHPDTLLAYAMNGETLPKDHGYPLRAVVPGWVGSSWIKWLGRIVVSSEPFWTRNNTTSYVLIGEDYPPEGQADGVVVTAQTVKSALALPWPAELPASRQRVHGYAHSPSSVSRVEWSADSGSTWNEADLHGPQVQYSWMRFEFTWSPGPGEYTLMTRATDTAGNTQPDAVPFNKKGYLFNQPLPHPVMVS